MLTKALSLKAGAGQLHLSFRPTYFYTSPDQVYLLLSAEIARLGLSFRTQGDSLISVLDVVGIISSTEGKTILRFSEPFRVQLNKTKEKQTNSPDVTYRRNLLLPPGEYKLKLIVADEKGQVGSTERNLTISPSSSSAPAMSALVVTQRTRPMPELIQDLQSQLLEEDDPLVYKGHQILVPVEYKLDRQLPMILFFKIHNLRGIDPDRRLVARLRFVNETHQTLELPLIDLRETALPTGPNEVAVGLNFSLQSVMPGNYKLIVEATDAKSHNQLSEKQK
jgi:hypothetical protein